MTKIVIAGIIGIASLSLCACNSASKDAERELAMIEATPSIYSKDRICLSKQRVADAYLSENNLEDYKRTQLYADVACMSAKLDASY